MTEKMMKFLAEAEKDAAFAEKVNTVESLDALVALAKEKGYELTAEDLKFDLPTGELDDAELDDVAGGVAMVNSAIAGSAIAGSAIAGSAVAGSAVAGSAVAGSAVAGSAVAGSAVAGSAVAGSAVAGSVMSSLTSLIAQNLTIRFGLSGGISIDQSNLKFLGFKE